MSPGHGGDAHDSEQGTIEAEHVINAGGLWVRLDELPRQALPTLMKKVVAHARDGRRKE